MKDHYKTNGAFSWNELMTTDPEAAKLFYAELFGWELEDYPMEETNYTVVKVGGEGQGGIMQIPPEAKGAPPNWGTYITVDDVDATVEKATTLQATVLMPPRDVPEVGRMAIVQDPQGAVFMVITYVDMNA